MNYIVMSQYHDYGDIETSLRRVKCDTLNELMLDVFHSEEDEDVRINLTVLEDEELITYVKENLLDVDDMFTITVYEEESLKIILEKN